MTTCRLVTSTAAAVLVLLAGAVVTAQDPAAQRPTFKSAVDLVSVAAVVRDKHGRFARGLTKDDFVIEEAGTPRDIAEFRADDNAPVRVALLFDVSGSMRVASKIEDARRAARQVLSVLRLDGGISADQAAVFSFDMNLQSLQPFTADPGAIEAALSRVAPYGQTSLYDAIAQTARRVADASKTDRRRRAVIVLTDGIDTSSELKPEQVAALASEIDVPVYFLVVVSPLDQPGGRDAVGAAASEADESVLGTLSRWTGGELFMTSTPAHQSVAARQIVDELRHQYVIAFNAAPTAGWRPLTVRTKNKDLTVRARSGYTAGANAGS
jgi:Ca-activated chloride channel family protein